MNPLLDIDHLRASGAEPAWFGLGFIQLKLDDEHRMHFWHPSLTPDIPDDEIHDHRYTFTSEILKGTMLHETYQFTSDMFGAYEMVDVSCDPEKPITSPRRISGSIALTGTYYLTPGSKYTFPRREFHRSRTEHCISYLTREADREEFARVVRGKGAADICPFSNPKPVDELWDVIASLVKPEEEPPVWAPGYHLASIQRGELGEPSKIREELEEFIDATNQGVSIMALVELSDMLGSVEAYLAKHHPSIGLDDLKAMSDVTKRAFQNGRRR